MHDVLIDHYVRRHLDAGNFADEARLILQQSSWAIVAERLAALSNSNGGPVVRRGRMEWHYAMPAPEHDKWHRPGEAYPPVDPVSTFSVVAADGSQIFPDSRDLYPYAIVRVATVAINYGSDKKPIVRQTIYGPDDAFLLDALTGAYQAGERNALIGGFRDRQELAQAALAVSDLEHYGPRVVMVDGPLHPYDPDQAAIDAHDASIAAILASDATPVGVVSQGDARYCTRLAGLLENIESDKTWPFVTDRMVWAHLQDGEYSPAFMVASEYNQRAACPIGFAYTRVGFSILRVEFPIVSAWRKAIAVVQADSQRLEYPYVLLKAHQMAVIHSAERRAYLDRFYAALGAYGLNENRSPKETLKEIA